MTVVLFRQQSRAYFAGLGRWTQNVGGAYHFNTIQSALSFSSYHSLNDLVLLELDGGERRVVGKIQKANITRASARRKFIRTPPPFAPTDPSRRLVLKITPV
ncbi:MAG: hypothetical protein KGS61_09205 [Verrucomicrobia bacterium]|nr:hypothetical protein [Verrucomicrobiota bacterium]